MQAEIPLEIPVSLVLARQGIPHRIFRHPGPIISLEQAARERGQHPDQVIRSILFRLRQDQYLLVLVAGPRQVSWPSLRRYLQRSRLTIAGEDEVLAVTGYPIGAVSPIGLPLHIRILVDRNVLIQNEISIGSGVRGVTVIMKTTDLIRALGSVEVDDFTDQ